MPGTEGINDRLFPIGAETLNDYLFNIHLSSSFTCGNKTKYCMIGKCKTFEFFLAIYKLQTETTSRLYVKESESSQEGTTLE